MYNWAMEHTVTHVRCMATAGEVSLSGHLFTHFIECPCCLRCIIYSIYLFILCTNEFWLTDDERLFPSLYIREETWSETFRVVRFLKGHAHSCFSTHVLTSWTPILTYCSMLLVYSQSTKVVERLIFLLYISW